MPMMAMPQSEGAMRRHMMAEPPEGHGMDDMPGDMAAMRSRHDSMHEGGAAHDHGTAKAVEPVRFAKGSDSVVEGWGMPFYGPFEGPDGIGRDFDAEFFSPNTDFLFDWFRGERPTLYHHTWDKGVGTDRLGGVISHEKLDKGIWTRAQLDIRSKWYEAVRELVGKDALSFSSGAYPAGVEVAKSGEIMRWPWVELTLTPTPSNPYASLAAMKAMDWPPFPETGIEAIEFVKAPVPAQTVEDAETIGVAAPRTRRLVIVGVHSRTP